MCKIGIIIGILIVIAFAGLSANVQAQSDEGLVAEWHFDESSGNIVKDTSGNGNDGTIHGAKWVDGKFGKALSFDGVNDYVEVADDPSLDITDAITIEAWVKTQLTSRGRIVMKFGSPAVNGYLLDINENGYAGVFIRIADRDSYAYDTTSVADGQWHHIIGVRDTTNNLMRIYVDGVQKNTGRALGGSPAHNEPLLIGKDPRPAVGTYFNGIIDEVRIYKRALSAEEIKAHYEGGQTALTLTKTASPHSIKQGQTSTITITLKNTGTTEIKDIEVADTIPADLIYVGGETSKKYALLKPKDSREFQYVIQSKDAGTFNLDPAIATYADEKGNYYTAKSNTAKIKVIPSLITTPIPTLIPTSVPTPIHTSNLPTATVHLYGEKTDVVLGEDILLRLAAVNLITKPTMTVQVIIIPPSGMSVTSTGFVKSGAGLYTSTYPLQPGDGKDIEVRIKANQVGDFEVKGSIVYYFGEDKEKAEYRELKLQIKVRPKIEKKPIPTLPSPTPEKTQKKTPGFSLIIAFGVILLFWCFSRR